MWRINDEPAACVQGAVAGGRGLGLVLHLVRTLAASILVADRQRRALRRATATWRA